MKLPLLSLKWAKCQPIAWIIAYFDLAVNISKIQVSHLVTFGLCNISRYSLLLAECSDSH